MIAIAVDMDELTMDVFGHAESAPEGKDLVCCAVSVTVQQLIHSLENMEIEHGNIKKLDYEMKSGDVHLKVIPKDWGRLSVKNRMRYAVEGLQLIADNYPEYVKLEET